MHNNVSLAIHKVKVREGWVISYAVTRQPLPACGSEPLKRGWSELRCAVSIKHISDLEDLMHSKENKILSFQHVDNIKEVFMKYFT